jgi:hypothetical protein
MKSILVLVFDLAFNLFSKADQIAYITKAQADKAVKFLQD